MGREVIISPLNNMESLPNICLSTSDVDFDECNYGNETNKSCAMKAL